MSTTPEVFDLEEHFPLDTLDGELRQYTFDEVAPLETQHVWTVVESGDDDDENTLYALPGYHVVNRLYFVVSDKKWGVEDEDRTWIL